MRSCLTLYGPRIADALSALREMVKEIRNDASIERVVETLDPSMNLMTMQMIEDGEVVLGDHDFVIQWRTRPTAENLRQLIVKIDRTLGPTGCRYTIATKERSTGI